MALIPRHHFDSVEAKTLIRQGAPVVLTNGCPLAAKATDWSFAYLSDKINSDFLCDVFVSDSRRFMYWDSGKNKSGYSFTPPTHKITMPFQQFIETHYTPMRETDAGNDDEEEAVKDGSGGNGSQTASAPTPPNRSTAAYASKLPPEPPKYTRPRRQHYYLQAGLVAEMGRGMMQEYHSKFSLEYALLYKTVGNWDAFTSNLLLCGPKGAVTPLHYDEQQNMFAQLWGNKRVRLFPPDDFIKLYPYPMSHPCDRQAQVWLPATPGDQTLPPLPDGTAQTAFPNYSCTSNPPREVYADLNPGDVLYVPQYWWHQMEAQTDNTSISWWFKDTGKSARAVAVGEDGKAIVDESIVNLVAVRRNVENLIRQSFADGREVHFFFLAVAAGVLGMEEAEAEGVTIPVLPADAARTKDVRAHYKDSWAEIYKQAVIMVGMLPFFAAPGKAREFVHEMVRGRFNSFD